MPKNLDNIMGATEIKERYLQYHPLPIDDELPTIFGLYELHKDEPRWACVHCFLYGLIRGKQIERARHRRTKA